MNRLFLAWGLLALLLAPAFAPRRRRRRSRATRGSPATLRSAQVTAVEGTEGAVTHTRTAGFAVVAILPALRVQKTVAVQSGPVNGTTNPKRIPGSTQRYEVNVTNTGPGTVDASTLVIVDPVPSGAALYVATASGDPVQFVDGAVSSNLTFTYAANVSYSNRPGGAPPFDYVPTPDANGFDPSVTALRVAPSGTLAGASGGAQPSFKIVFRLCLP
jgi:uncharacterized repeat protein (TIGR01451 family)